MKFIIEDFDDKNLIVEDFAESLRRAKALANNTHVILNICEDKENLYGVEYDILCYGNNYADEFSIIRTSHANNMQQRFNIEILSDEQAKRNEIEEIMGDCVIGVDENDIENYKLGETVQSYTQIGSTKYWYREL